MTSLFRALRKGHQCKKHEKLSEDWTVNKEPVIDGVTFYVKYLGSTLLDKIKDEATSDAIKTVIAMAKASGRKLQRVSLSVSLRGITMIDMVTEQVHLDVSIYRISNCFVEASYSHVFAFLGTNKNETTECHCFLCPKKKMAQAAALTIAQAFNVAYEVWQISTQNDSENDSSQLQNNTLSVKEDIRKEKLTACTQDKSTTDNTMLINLSMDCEASTSNSKPWVGFDDDYDALSNSFARLASQNSEGHDIINCPDHYVLDLENLSRPHSSSISQQHRNLIFDDELYSERQPIIDLLCT